jgi:hypothetical protein
VDGIRRRSHGGALGESTGHEPSCKAGIEHEYLGNENRSCEAGERHDDRQQHGLEPIALQRLHELRTDRVADPEQEQQKQEGFGHGRHRYMCELANE